MSRKTIISGVLVFVVLVNSYIRAQVDTLGVVQKREYREVLISQGKFFDAIELIDQDEITYMDIHNSGSCAKPWIQSKQKIDYAKCYLGLGDTIRAIDSLFWDEFTSWPCLDVRTHLGVLYSIMDTATVQDGIEYAFKEMVCTEERYGRGQNTYTVVRYKMVFFEDTILSPHYFYRFSNCSDISVAQLDSMIKINTSHFYYRAIMEN